MIIKVGQVGIGTWGRNHCTLLSNMPDVKLCGLHDINFKRCGKTAQDFGALEFRRLDELIAHCDALFVTAPTRQHFEFAKMALSADKHVFLEKPMCAASSEARDLVQLARERGLVLQVGHIERFNPAFQALAEMQPAPRYIEAQRLAPYSPRGGDTSVVLDLMIHDLDLVQHLVNAPVAEVAATGMAVRSTNIDFANAYIRFENGCVANLTASRISESKVRKMNVFEPHVSYSLDFIKRAFREIPYNGSKVRQSDALEQAQKRNLLLDEIEAFLYAIRNSAKPVVDGSEGLRALHLAETVIQEIERNASKLAMSDLESGTLG